MEVLANTPGWSTFQDQACTAASNDDPTALLVAEHDWLRSIIMATDQAFNLEDAWMAQP